MDEEQPGASPHWLQPGEELLEEELEHGRSHVPLHAVLPRGEEQEPFLTLQALRLDPVDGERFVPCANEALGPQSGVGPEPLDQINVLAEPGPRFLIGLGKQGGDFCHENPPQNGPKRIATPSPRKATVTRNTHSHNFNDHLSHLG